MKKIVVSLLFIIVLVGCSNEKVMESDTPTNASTLMKLNIDNQNYDAFESLFYEGAEGNVSKSTFQQFDDISSAGANYKTYELLTFDNGEMLLVEFAPKTKGDKDYKIVNVKSVPDDMKALFEQ